MIRRFYWTIEGTLMATNTVRGTGRNGSEGVLDIPKAQPSDAI